MKSVNFDNIQWKDLDISRQSIMGLWDGKHILATTPFHEVIFLGFGKNRYCSKVVFILQKTGESWVKICPDVSTAKDIASKVAVELMTQTSREVMKKYLFAKVGNNNEV